MDRVDDATRSRPVTFRSIAVMGVVALVAAGLGAGAVHFWQRGVVPSLAFSPDISPDLGSDFVPTPGENYMICYTIQDRTLGHIKVRFGGLEILGTGNKSVTHEIWIPACTSVTAVSAEKVSFDPSVEFNGRAHAAIHRITPHGSTEGVTPRVRPYGTALSYYIGARSGQYTTTGTRNVGFGEGALENVVTGEQNLAIGPFALNHLTGARANVAIGLDSLHWNTTGYANTAVGVASLWSNETGYANTAVGIRSLALSTTGIDNTGLGTDALEENTVGNRNAGFGAYAGRMNRTSSNNTVGGYSSLYNYTGRLGQNTAFGANALVFLKDGGNNNAFGVNAGLGAITAVNSQWFGLDSGNTSLQAPDVNNSTAIGAFSYTDADNQISLGNESVREVRTWGSYAFKRSYPNDGEGVANGSLFMGEDGELYFKARDGHVSLLSGNKG